MGDLKLITVLVFFLFIFSFMCAMYENSYVAQENITAGQTYETPDLSIFDFLGSLVNLSTGNILFDGLIWTFRILVAALTYRALRGQ